MLSETLETTLRRAAAKQLHRFEQLRTADFADPEVIHDLRVALRRLRSIWRIAEEMGDRQARKLRRRARRQALALGTVRDLDVLILRVESDRVEGHVGGAEADEWVAALRQRRDDAVAEARDVLASEKSERWLEKTGRWAAVPDDGPSVEASAEAEADCWREELGRHIVGHARSVLGRCPPADDDEQHLLRIEVKRLRYLLEFFKGRVPRSASAIKSLVFVQDVLGEARDRRAAAALAVEAGLEAYSAWLESGASDGVDRAVVRAQRTAERLVRDWGAGDSGW